MIGIELTLKGDGAWPELMSRNLIRPSAPMKVAGLAGGMQSGKPSVTIRIDVSSTESVIVETSLALFLQTADSLKAVYGDPREQSI